MTDQPKKRGRPSKADIAARTCQDCGRLDGHYDDCPRGIGVGPHINSDTSREPEDVIESAAHIAERAQAYAMRVWAGQARDVKRAEKIARVQRALQGQNLPTDGIRYPGDADDDEEWSDADSQPVTWRKRA
jgi:hypothetical protein